ncbi:hypothetical protein AB0K09_29965 [Streptomyces sp. NPDC049577]|uniref:hypothetical protein n=1 Tax=Streptomyces sp. NPDC049577 TaxID=3155153 RepID=UPI00343F8FEE
MAEAEFNATGVRIERSLRSLTRAGQVKIQDGRLELLTSRGQEIDSAPLDAVHASKPWFAARDRARAKVNGTRYVLTLGGAGEDSAGAAGGTEGAGESTVRRFLDAVRSARAGGAKR